MISPEATYIWQCIFYVDLVVAKFLSGIFSPLTSAEACEKSSRWLWKRTCVSTGMRKPGNTLCIINHHDMTLAVKVVLNLNITNFNVTLELLAHRSTKCSEWAIVIIHRPLSSGVRPSSVRSHFLVYTLASTNINQSAPNLVHMYMTIRSRMSSIIELIGPELSYLSALELEHLPYLTLCTL